jgi:phenylalanyl-tRNA synthetase beta chain
LLAVLERNVRAGAERVAIFELGRVFHSPDAREEKHVALLFWGSEAATASWRASGTRRLDLFDLKGAIEAIIGSAEDLRFHRTEHRDLALAIEIRLGEEKIGIAGQLTGLRAKELGADGAVLVAEISCDPIFARAAKPSVFRELEKFPAVTRDIAMIVPEKVGHAEILRVIETPREALLERVELFDLFTGSESNNLGSGRKSLAYRLTYRDRNRTLTGEEVTAAHAKIRERLQSELSAELRE